MHRVGLVLGGGGITGAAYQMATLMAIELATGWNPNDADVVIGTSGGAYVTALVRNDALHLDSVVRTDEDRSDVAERIRSHVFRKDPGGNVGHWVKYGLGPGLVRPGVTLFMGSPARYSAKGLRDWVSDQVGGDRAESWPAQPTAIVAYDIADHRRTAFGTEQAPPVAIADAVAASSAIPVLFRPYEIDGTYYIDAGVTSGTHADLVLGAEQPLDLVLIIAPLAAETQRKRAKFHEKMFDRVGLKSLEEETLLIKEAWPHCDVVTLAPSPSVQNVMRPNPMDPTRAVATFIRTLLAKKRRLGEPEIWERLDHHLVAPGVGGRVRAL